MTDQVKPQPLLSDEEIQDQLRPFEDMVVIDSELDVEVNLAFFKAVCAQAKLAALPRSEPKEAGDEYEGDTAKGWYEAWNRENDAWQKMVQHHEELEEAVKVMLKDGMKPTEYLEAMEKVRRILAIEGSAPAKSAPEAVAQVLASSLGATESRWGEAKGNAEGTAPVKTEAEGGWMPIETAPKDGTWVLVTGWNHGKKGTERHQAVVRWCEECNGWTDEQDDGDEPKALAFLTHWRPLPAPPALGDL